MTTGSSESVNICVAASGDWSAPTRVNCHEIAERWTAFGRVAYLEPAPLRAPRRRDLARIARRVTALGGASPGGGEVVPPAGLTVCRPPYLPWHPTPAVRRLNAWMAGRTPLLRRLPWDVLWFFSPALAGLERHVRARLIVYHAVDDYAANPDVRPKLVRDTEERLVRAADLVFATSATLAARLGAAHPSVVLLENVTDPHRLRPLPDTTTPARVAAFVGNLAAHKVDFRLLLDVACSAADWTFILVGPRHGSTSELEALLGLPNVRYFGARRRHELPELLSDVSVALLPLPRGDLQESSFPMKVLDYFALGLPVVGPVSRALESVRGHLVDANSPDEFVAALGYGLKLRCDSAFRRRMRDEAERRSWGARMLELRRLIEGGLVARRVAEAGRG